MKQRLDLEKMYGNKEYLYKAFDEIMEHRRKKAAEWSSKMLKLRWKNGKKK